MLSPEKNFVAVEKLFKWGKKIEILDTQSKVMFECFIKLVGDADMNKARVFGLRKSAELRRKLKDLESDERIAYIASKEVLTLEELTEYVLLLQNKTIIETAYKTVRIPFPKEPNSEASLEAQEKYQLEIDGYQEKVKKTVREYVDAEITKERQSLAKLDFDTLYVKYESLVTNDFCELEMLNSFRDFCVAAGSFKDESYTDKLFKSVEEFKDLPQDIKQQFETEYNSLEIDIETLKKLPEVTPSPGFGV